MKNQETLSEIPVFCPVRPPAAGSGPKTGMTGQGNDEVATLYEVKS